MSMGPIIVLAAIVGVFGLFTAVLARVDYRAQQLVHRIRDRERKEEDNKTVAAASGITRARWPQPSDNRLQHVA
jgi:hypothetical protein